MAAFLRTLEFDAWLKGLRDPIGKARILARIRSAEAGNFGDSAPVGGGVSEMRVHVGPGYRVYYCRRGEVTYLLLCGGDKSSQRRDIRIAKHLLSGLEGSS
ncbi:MAG: type II toxin-antitoxin system RelE/ParE family toxin [Gemmatimonadales bacterium]|nr:type II toxin-antitoxin system RelE/ParE family toxin [Gemmatimonadales bacterium]